MHNSLLGGYTAYASPSEVRGFVLSDTDLGNVGTSISVSVSLSYSVSVSWSISWT